MVYYKKFMVVTIIIFTTIFFKGCLNNKTSLIDSNDSTAENRYQNTEKDDLNKDSINSTQKELEILDYQTKIYFDDKLKFSVEYPNEWSYEIETFLGSTSNREASADGGIKLYINEQKNNQIYIFKQTGHISIPEAGFNKERFVTRSGINGYILSKNSDGKREVYLILGEGFYGAHVSVDIEYFENNEELLMYVLKSIDLSDD